MKSYSVTFQMKATSAVLLSGTAYYVVNGVFNFWNFGQNHTVWLFKWNPFTHFLYLILRFSILRYETRNFSWTSRGKKSTFKIEPCPIKVHRMFSFWGAEEGGARETMVTNEKQKYSCQIFSLLHTSPCPVTVNTTNHEDVFSLAPCKCT